MKLTVLGATGAVGRHLVDQALRDQHEVVAVVRNASRLAIRHEALSVVEADPLDAASLVDRIDGADAVLSCIGPVGRRDQSRPASRAAEAAVTAMSKVGVNRILAISAAPLNRAGIGQPFVLRRVAGPMLWRLLRQVYADLEAMEAVLQASELAWTAVRPPRLTNRRPSGRYRYDVDRGPKGSTISRADLATAMLHLVADPATHGHAVGVSA